MTIKRGKKWLRFLDRFVGIPAVFFLGLFKSKGRLKKTLRRIAILETAAIGDTILVSPIIEDIHLTYPEAGIIFFCGHDNHEAARLIPTPIKIVRLDLKNPVSALFVIRSFAPFDVWMDCGPWPRLNAILSFFAKAGYKIGFESPRQYRHFVYHRAVSHLNHCHEIDNLRRLAKAIGVFSSKNPLFKPRPKNLEGDKNAVIHMFPAGFKSWFKEWPESRWLEVINFLTGKGYRIYLTGGKSDFPNAENIRKKSTHPDKIINLAGLTTLPQTAQYLAAVNFVITVNTGTLHLAAAVGVPIIALQGPTSTLRWGDSHPK